LPLLAMSAPAAAATDPQGSGPIVAALAWMQGTLLGSKAALGRYPPLARGEDTPVILDLLRRNRRVTRLREHGYLYVYVFDGDNAWGHEHHATISAWKRFRGARLLALEPMLRARLAEYEPPLGQFVMPYESGTLVFAGVSAGET